MKDKIRSKMEAHIKSILDKPIITDEEYKLIASYYDKLDFEEKQAENKKNMEESNKRMHAMVDMLGTSFNS